MSTTQNKSSQSSKGYEYFLLPEHARKESCTLVLRGVAKDCNYSGPVNLKDGEDKELTIKFENSKEPPRKIKVISHLKLKGPSSEPFLQYLYEKRGKRELVGKREKK